MRRLSYHIILCLLVISAVFPLTAQQKKKTAAVLEFASPNLSKEDMLNLTNRFRSLLSQTNSFDMIERDKMKDILKEQDWVLTENCNSAECAVQVGQLLGAEIMFAGDIGKMGQLYTIDIRMLDVSTGKILLTKTEDYKGDIEGLLGVMKLIANEFAGIKTEGRGKGAIIVAGQESFGTAVFKLPVDGATPVINGVAGNPVFSKDIKLNLPAGVHKIKFTKSGYAATQEFTVQIKENEETSQTVEMKEDKSATAGADLSLNYGIVSIATSPAGAKVLDGDIEVGTTPVSGLKLSLGSHTLTLKKSKYHTQAFTVDIKDGFNRIPEKTLAPNFGTLKITSLPAGAKVKINGMLKQGTTPLTFDEFQSGFYEIEVERDRYFAEKKSVEVKDLQVAEASFTLKPQFADVTINSNPSGAKVYLDNEYIGTTPLVKKGEAEGILAGKYNLRLTMNSDLYMDYEDAITVKAGEPLNKTIDIKSNFGTIKIVTEMTGVKVLVNGIENKEFSRDLQARLKPGNYEIEILKNKHQPVKKTVSLADGAVETIQAQFIAKQGRIIAYSVPDGADLILSDEQGKEIIKGKNIDQMVLIGSYTIKAQMEGYGNVKTKTITVTEGYKEPIEFTFTDEDKMPSISVTTDPAGADVYVDGKLVGKSPVTINPVTVGEHTLKALIKKDGKILSAEKNITAIIGSANSVSLKPIETNTKILPGHKNEMIFIPGGTFEMGDVWGDGDRDEKPVHTVTVSDFYMSKYEVTVGMFKQFIDETGYKTDADKDGGSYIWNGKEWKKTAGVNWKCDAEGNVRSSSEHNHPVIHVSWNDAKEFCSWLSRKAGRNYRLPYEAEWEYAAREGGKKDYKYSGSNNIDEVAWYYDNSGSKTHPVGSKKPNALGLYDMTGNVWEWCEDWYDKNYYKNSPSVNPKGPSSGTYRVLRGGGWDDKPQNLRASYRSRNGPDARNNIYGFRLCVSAE